jgi:hypothetical protein
MSYICAHGRELVEGQAKNMVPVIVRLVNYNNYELSMRGNKLVKQYMGTTNGTEVVKEVSVCKDHLDEWKERNPVQVLEETKNVDVEYSRSYIKTETIQQAIQNGRVVTIDTPPNAKEENQWQGDESYQYNDEPDEKYD